MYPSSEKRFLKINFISIITLFVLILAGGIVRSSGSGMGCPDWPKCFDQFIPPTNSSQLPDNYLQKYVDKRVAKNERFAKMLDVFGFGDMAIKIRKDQSIFEHEEFNAVNTWIEYINRLIGVICGFLLIGCLFFSVTYIRSRKKIFFLSLLNLILVGFQGWLGSIVVSTNLLSWVVTVHMLLALAILAISIYTYFQAKVWRERHILTNRSEPYLRGFAIFAILLTLVQITLGTTVREQIDEIAKSMNNMGRSEWVSNVGSNFNIHRDLAIAVVIVNVILFVMVRSRYLLNGLQFKFISLIIFLIVLQIITGIVLSYLALPPVSQATHLFLASLLFGAQFYLMLLLGRNKMYRRKLA
ncbi:COX15/CtaA family protein [Daejeonella oryzae]|uniref:COX15/CtaA family protein n=1 Tax=Daejeonella oryzae TaxID=1122943 RepID=UPI0004127079|nr:COX15/CtaA family protein [Daejeonella oryzae]